MDEVDDAVVFGVGVVEHRDQSPLVESCAGVGKSESDDVPDRNGIGLPAGQPEKRMLIVERGDGCSRIEHSSVRSSDTLRHRQPLVVREVALARIEQREFGFRVGDNSRPAVHRRSQSMLGWRFHAGLDHRRDARIEPVVVNYVCAGTEYDRGVDAVAVIAGELGESIHDEVLVRATAGGDDRALGIDSGAAYFIVKTGEGVEIAAYVGKSGSGAVVAQCPS